MADKGKKKHPALEYKTLSCKLLQDALDNDIRRVASLTGLEVGYPMFSIEMVFIDSRRLTLPDTSRACPVAHRRHSSAALQMERR